MGKEPSVRWKKLASLLLLCCSILFFNSALYAEPQQELTVSAAISLKNAFDEIGKAFEAEHKGAKVHFNYGASGDLKKQIEGGAPVDVYASASPKEMDELKKQDRILQDTVVNFAQNSIVLIQPADARAALPSFNDLKKEEVKRIAIGNPKTVPAGRYAQETLEYFKVFDALKNKFVLAENVRQALDYVARGEVDAGIVYLTDAKLMTNKVKIAVIAPETSHKPVIYPIAVVNGTKNEVLAKEFVKSITSEQTRRILEKYGFNKTGK